MRKFMEVIDGTPTELIVKEGGTYKKKRYGKNSSNSIYENVGLFIIEEDIIPEYNEETEELVHTYLFNVNKVIKTYKIISLPPDMINENMEKLLIETINNIVVDYEINSVIYQFSGSLIAQNRITVALAKKNGKPTETQNWFTVDSQKVQLTSKELEDILALIDVQMELITNI